MKEDIFNVSEEVCENLVLNFLSEQVIDVDEVVCYESNNEESTTTDIDIKELFEIFGKQIIEKMVNHIQQKSDYYRNREKENHSWQDHPATLESSIQAGILEDTVISLNDLIKNM